MTKQHFIAFARELETIADLGVRLQAAMVVVRVAERSNPRFDRGRFLLACGLSEGE